MAQIVASLLARVSLPLPLPLKLQITPDWRVAGYAALLTVIATLATGLLPAWQSVREAIVPDLARRGRLRLRRNDRMQPLADLRQEPIDLLDHAGVVHRQPFAPRILRVANYMEPEG